MNTLFELDAINNLRMTVLGCNSVILDENWKSTMFSSPYSRLYFIKNGDGFIKTEDGTVKLEGGKVYLIPAEFKFSYGCTYLEKTFFHISVRTPERYDLLSNIGKVCSMPFSAEEYEKLIKMTSSPDSYEKILGVKAFLMETLSKFARDFSEAETPVKKYGEIVKNVISLVSHNPSIKADVKEFADRLYISESKLRNEFLKEMGIPIGKYIDDMIFIKAKQLLHKEQLSIAEISAELGFCDQFYFSRRFKEKFGETPSSFRKKKPEDFI